MTRFTKMHGAGNDYIYVDCFEQSEPANWPELARTMSDRHTGVGADGLILIGGSQKADVRMRMWNADGSEAEMCGNGVRCVAKYVYDRGIVRNQELTVETGRGVLTLQLEVDGERVRRVRVNMGPPVLDAAEIPTRLPGNPPINVPLEVGGRTVPVCCISMGNPHCVAFVDEPSDRWVLDVGPQIETHTAFPSRTNAEFVQVLSPREVCMRVWERGTGETLACGTGACAALVAGVLSGRTAREITARLPGGELTVEWPPGGDVYLTGPAVEVFEGQWPAAA